MTERLDAGVVGVGSMGANHARVYDELSDVRLVGVADADADRAAEVAEEYDTRAVSETTLFAAADLVSIAVPTRHHATAARTAIEADVGTLVEKPLVRDPAAGRELASLADEREVTLQVGHIERFNPAVTALYDLVEADDLLSVRANRLGPPVDRDSRDDVVMDLMIHDIDIFLSLVDSSLDGISAAATADGGHCTAQLTFESGVVGSLTASRVTQKRARTLEVIAPDRFVEVDYLDQSVRIHRQAEPSYESTNGGVRYRNKRVTEHPFVDSREPLKCELEAFVDAVRTGSSPRVDAGGAIRAVEVAEAVRKRAAVTRSRPGTDGPASEAVGDGGQSL